MKKGLIITILSIATIIIAYLTIGYFIRGYNSPVLNGEDTAYFMGFYMLAGGYLCGLIFLLVIDFLYYWYFIKKTTRVAYLAGGCFWCCSQVFYDVKGIINVTSGYMGGTVKNPTYLEVKEGNTGHLETIRIEYDSNIISYQKILDIYFDNIEPLNDKGQYIDVGSNYLPAIFVSGMYQRIIAGNYCHKVEKMLGQKLAVTIRKRTTFYNAEEEHQDYHIKNPEAFEEEIITSGRKKKEKGVFSQGGKYYKIIKQKNNDFDVLEITKDEYISYLERND